MKNQINSTFPALLAAFILIMLCLPAQAEANLWSERKLDKTILKIDRDLTRKRWDKVIKRS
ncbi:MAG: hypothetical protein ACPH64_09540, partial [Porticoccaceae bacterium]